MVRNGGLDGDGGGSAMEVAARRGGATAVTRAMGAGRRRAGRGCGDTGRRWRGRRG